LLGCWFAAALFLLPFASSSSKVDVGFINPRARQVYQIVSSNTTVKWVSIPRGLKD
ncbi:hypothetical protein PIB30_090401, partial [Stylosanthes scabra]|nr:hypothetical protein [Stylosanthes scabra]